MQTVPDSHYWTGLEGIIISIDFDIKYHATERERKERIKNSEYPIADMYEPLTPEYLIIGLRNALKNGYELKYNNKTKITSQVYFNSIKNIIEHLEETDWTPKFLIQVIQATINNGYDLKCERKMERQEVYRCLDTERQYQDLRWTPRREANETPDESKPPAEWINYIEFHLNKAKEQVYFLNEEETLAELRKVAALAVRCLELHGCPERNIPNDLLVKK